MLGEKSSEKMQKNVFYIHTNIETKKWGKKNARNNFSKNTRFLRSKNVGKKSSVKSAKIVFYIHTNIVNKKWGQKMHETIFPVTRIERAKNLGKKSSVKVRKNVYIFTRIT